MNPTLADSYSRAMRAALSGNGYSGTQPTVSRSTQGSGMNVKAKRPLFDFTADDVRAAPVDLVEAVFKRIRAQDWSSVFLMLFLVLVPSGFAIFVFRDSYYRRRGGDTIQLELGVK